MSDQVLLFVLAITVAAASWAFWHFLGENAFTVLSTLILVSVVADNIRLRRKLKSLQQQ